MKPLKKGKGERWSLMNLAKERNLETRSQNKEDRRPHYIVACATLSLIVTIMIFVLGIITIMMIDDIEEQTAARVEQLQEQQFNEVWGLIVSTHHSAALQSNLVRDRIIRAIERTYGTPELLEKLQYELSNPSGDSQITQIFMTAIDGMYMFHNTDFNGMSVIVTYNPNDSDASPQGYLAATHNNNFLQNIIPQRDRDEIWLLSEITENTHNPRLTEQQLNHTMSHTPIVDVIPFSQIDYPASAHTILTMDRHAVYEAFLAEGMATFYGLVVSGSASILERTDIFGVPSISPAGNMNNNHVIVVSQHFRVADMLNMHHAGQIARYNLLIETAIEDGVLAMGYQQVVFIILVSFWLVFMIVISVVQNGMANKIELSYLRELQRIQRIQYSRE